MIRPPARREPFAPRKTGGGPRAVPADLLERLEVAEQLALHGRMAASAVHEISNLMTIVLFNAALLRESRRADDSVQRYLDPLLQAGKRIAQLCGQLRDRSRLERVEPRLVDLAATVAGTCQLLQRIVLRRFVVEVPDGGAVQVLADPAQLDQILINLVFNARDATADDGVITVRAGCRPEADGWRYFEVEDNGVGMPPGVQKRLFTMFYTTKPRGSGTGLGLSTVHRLTQEMGGRIELDSECNRGTRVRIWLPPPRPPDS